MNAIIIDIADLIEAETDFVTGTDLFLGRTPTSPGNVLTLLDAPDRGPMLMPDKDEKYEYGAFQVRMRHSDYTQAHALCDLLIGVLHNEGNIELNGTYYTLIQAMDSPFLLDWDENNRARVVVNFHIQRKGLYTTNDT